ncbi:MAG: AsmA family protein [Proteobacteria bacterium]|nr:MAG: AsmA family protein [Pseudomonadota bacterium]
MQLNGPIGWSVFPWIAIELNDVTVANETGFKGDYLAQIGTLSARVKLLPLLKKDIQVDTVELKKPSIHLMVAKSGQTNWQSLLDHLAGEDSQQTDSPVAVDMNIEGIVISGGQLNYRDATADSTIQISDMKFSSSAITANMAVDMSLRGQLMMAEQELTADLTTEFVVNHLLSEQAMVIDFNGLSLAGYMADIPLKVSAGQAGQLDMGTDQLQFKQINLSYANINMTTSVNGNGLNDHQASYSGQLKVAPFDVAEYLQQMGDGLNNQAGNQLAASMDWSMRGQVLAINNIKAQLDDSQLTGQVTISNLDRMAGDFKLQLDHLNLDQYLPQTESATTTSQDADDDVDFGYLEGQITIGRLTAMGTTLNNIQLNMTTRGRELAVRPLTADFYQGLLKTELTLAPDKTVDKLVLKHSMQDIQAGPLLTDLMGEGLLSGLGQLQADIRVNEPFSQVPLRTANGHLSYHLSDGAIKGIDLVQMTQKALSLLNKTEAAEANKALQTEFASMALEADVVDGVIKTKKLSLKSPYFDLIGEVQVDLVAQSIKGTIQPMLINIPPGVLDNRFERLLNHRIPVSLSGSMLSPSFGVDIKQLLINTQKDKIDAKKEELKQDLFDSLLGKDKKPEEKPIASDEQAADDTGDNKDGDKTEDTAGNETEEVPKEDSKDRLKRELLEGLFKKSRKEPEPEPDTSEHEPEPQPEPGMA